MKSLYFLVAFLSLLKEISGLKILAVTPFPSKSHFAVGYEIIKTLAEAGHETTIITPYAAKTPPNNYREIFIPEMLDFMVEKEKDFNPFVIHRLPSIISIPMLHGIGKDVVKGVMEHPKVIDFMKSDEKFDICFLESFHANSLTGIFEHVGCKFVSYSSAATVQWVDVLTSNQSPSSYVVMPCLAYSDLMNFKERFWNTLYVLLENISYYTYHLPMQRSLYKKYFPNAKKSFDEVVFNPSLVFLNNHFSLTGARPYLPNMIEIGGIHVSKKKDIPQEFKKFVSFSEGGFIVFSMGSIVQAEQFPEKTREAFVKAFGKLKQKVIWKYENETLPNKPDNVMISSWIPQRDLLAHPNCKLFITHGGFLGTTEAAAEGVPMLGLPMFGDQFMNLEFASSQGRAISLEIDDVNEEMFSDSLNKLLKDPKYQENAKITAKRYNDRPMTPQVTVTYWTQFIARHDGAEFLSAAGNKLSAIEFHLIDVYATLLAIFIFMIFIIYVILRALYRRLFSAKKVKKQKAN